MMTIKPMATLAGYTCWFDNILERGRVASWVLCLQNPQNNNNFQTLATLAGLID